MDAYFDYKLPLLRAWFYNKTIVFGTDFVKLTIGEIYNLDLHKYCGHWRFLPIMLLNLVTTCANPITTPLITAKCGADHNLEVDFGSKSTIATSTDA